MRIWSSLALLSTTICLGSLCTPLFCQVNMAALAQFKQNQQQELAQRLQPQSTTGAKGKKHGQAAMTDPMSADGRPSVIRAPKMVYKANYSDMHHKNVR